jgi:hypothetical protein
MNSAGKGSVIFHIAGVVCLFSGIYVAAITRINLVTGQESSPYLAVGISLAAIGILAVAISRRTAKRNLTK